jgi:hypothetical protein
VKLAVSYRLSAIGLSRACRLAVYVPTSRRTDFV